MKARKMKLEVELPVLSKFLCCLPLRIGLIFWGYAQLTITFFITWSAITAFAEKSQHVRDFALFNMILIFLITMIVSLLEVINCMFLILGAQRKNANFLEVCYHYLKVKMIVWTSLVIFTFILHSFFVCEYWYYRNLDPWRSTQLIDELSLALLDLALQFYLFLLVKSYIIKLEHNIDFSTLYQRFQSVSTNLQDGTKCQEKAAVNLC